MYRQDEAYTISNIRLASVLLDRFGCDEHQCILRISIQDTMADCHTSSEGFLFVGCNDEFDCQHLRELDLLQDPLISYQEICDGHDIFENFELIQYGILSTSSIPVESSLQTTTRIRLTQDIVSVVLCIIECRSSFVNNMFSSRHRSVPLLVFYERWANVHDKRAVKCIEYSWILIDRSIYLLKWLRIYEICLNTINSFLPLCINLIAGVILLVFLAKNRHRVSKKERYGIVFISQMRQHEDLLVVPMTILVAKISFLLIGISIKCIREVWHIYLSVSAYCPSLVPLISTSVTFVCPSSSYMRKFKEQLGCLHWRPTENDSL